MSARSVTIGRSDVAWSYVSLAFNALANVVLLPLILRLMSPAEVGLWYVYTAIGGFVAILDMGFITTIARNVTYVWCGAEALTATGYTESPGEARTANYPLLSRLMATSRLVYGVVAAVVTVGLASIGSLYVGSAASGEGVASAFVWESWAVYCVGLLLNIAFAYWTPLLRGVGAIRQSNQANVAAKVTQLVVAGVGLLLGGGLLAITIAYLASALVLRFLAVNAFMRYQGNRAALRAVPRVPLSDAVSLFRIMWPNAYRQGIVATAQFLLASGPVFVATSWLGLEAAAQVGLTLQILGVVKVISNALFNAYLPVFTEARIQADTRTLRSVFGKSVGTSNYLLAAGGLTFVLAGPFVFRLLGSNVEAIPVEVGLLVLVGELLSNQQTLAGAFLATGNRVPMYRAYAVSALVITGCQVVAVNVTDWGLWAVFVPLVIGQLVYNDWVWVRRAGAELGLKLIETLRLVIVGPFTKGAVL